MRLTRAVPLLFAVPTDRASSNVIYITIFCVWAAAVAYLSASIWSGFPYFESMSLLLVLHGSAAIYSTGFNLLIMFRYFLVWILIFGSALVWAVYNGDVLVAPFGPEFQTVENTRELVFAGYLSLCGSLLGWHLSLRNRKVANIVFEIPTIVRKKLIYSGIALSLLFALLYVIKTGGFVGGGKTYADGQGGFDLQFGVFNIFHFVGISLLILASIGRSEFRMSYLWIGIITLFMGVLTGSRADFLPQMIIIILLLFNDRVRGVLTKQRSLTMMVMLKWILFGVILLLLGYILAFAIAIWRQGVAFGTVLEYMFHGELVLFVNTFYGHKMLYFETGNMMLGGLYSAIVQVREGITGYLWGESYLNYILFAPPAFLELPRPLGLEWLTDINGITMTQGGIFEVAEAYWNFGLVGCFVVSFLISYSFGWLLRRGLELNSYFYMVWYLVSGFMSFRAVWYQNFSYFRILTVMLVVYVAALFLFRWFVAKHNKRTAAIVFLKRA